MSFLNSIRWWNQSQPAKIQGARAEATPSKPKSDGSLDEIITPQARDWWRPQTLALYTPETVERILRGSMLGNLSDQVDLFDLMEDTWPRLAKNLNEIKDAVLGLEWELQAWSAKGQDATAESIARRDLVEDLVWSMHPEVEQDENGFEDTIRDLMDAWAKGISVLEIEWELGSSQGGSALAPKSTRHVPSRFYGYPMNAHWLGLKANEVGVNLPEGLESVDGFVRFPENKFLIAVRKTRSGHAPTTALLRPLAWWWCAAMFGGEWLLNNAQLFGQPFRWATYDPKAKNVVGPLSAMLEQMGHCGWAAFPVGTTLELKEAARSASDNPQALILQLADKTCDILVLRQSLTTDVGDSGSRALGAVHQGVRGDVINSAGAWVAGVLNTQLIPMICRLNYGDDELCPYFVPSAKVDGDPILMAQRDKLLIEAGMKFPLRYIHDRHKVPMPAEGEAVLETPAPAPMGPGGMVPGAKVQARDATERLIDNTLENLTDVEARWLAGVRPFFANLVAAAQSGRVSDADFETALVRASAQLPMVFKNLDVAALRDALYEAMSAAVVNGAVEGAARRRAQGGKR